MAGKKRPSEAQKKLILVGLVVVMVGVFVWQLGPGGKPARPRTQEPAPASASRTASVPIQTQNQAERAALSDQDAAAEQLLADLTPLDLGNVMVGNGGTSVKRNVFAYYVKPPDPPPPPPPPPPIAVKFVQPQNSVAGTPRSFTLTVTGEAFPPDAQIIFGGVAKPTKRLSDAQLTAEIKPNDYMSAGTISVEVKSQGDPVKLYSNQATFMAQQAPDPPFKFLGIIGDLAVFEYTTQSNQKDIIRLRKNDKLSGVWRIDSISEAGVEVTDTRYDIRKRIPVSQGR